MPYHTLVVVHSILYKNKETFQVPSIAKDLMLTIKKKKTMTNFVKEQNY